MRPDSRSFSFTWLRGQQHLQELNLGRARTRSQTQRPSGSVRLEESSSPSGNINQQENNMSVQQRCSMRNLRGFRASRVWNPKKYIAIDENDVQTEEQSSKDSELATKDDSNTSDSASGSKSTVSTSLGRRLNRTMQDVKNSFGSLSQIIRRSTRRRYRMTSPISSEMSPTRRILGRTPTKLYSPFGFDSPIQKTSMGLVRPSTPRLAARRTLTPGRVYSPTNNFKQDVKDARRGLRELHVLSRDITRRSVRF